VPGEPKRLVKSIFQSEVFGTLRCALAAANCFVLLPGRIQRALNLFYLPARQQKPAQNPMPKFFLANYCKKLRFRNFETCVNLHEFTVGILESRSNDGSKVVAGYRRLCDSRRQYRVQLLWHERVLSVLRARVWLEPNGDFRRLLTRAHRIGIVGADRRLLRRSGRTPAHHVHRHRDLRLGFHRPQFCRLTADALRRYRFGHCAWLEPRLPHADQPAHRKNIS